LVKKHLKIKKAKHSGFCFGVKRAVGRAEDFLKDHKEGYSLGSIIHNPSVVERLSEKGLKVIKDINKAKNSHLVIRSHGISPRLKNKAKALSICTVDATCPFVDRSHKIVTKLKKEGYKIIIIGQKDHPEVEAILEVAGKRAIAIAKKSDLSKLNLKNKNIAVIAQTTLSRDKFFEVTTSLLKLDAFECRIFDTICNDVTERQKEAKALSKTTDIIIVVGGKVSANTRYLTQICREQGARTHHIETDKEIKRHWFKSVSSVGIVSGASTPSDIIEAVIKKIKSL